MAVSGDQIVLDPPALRKAESASYDDPEPKVLTEDVEKVLRRVVRPDDPNAGDSVSQIAEKANTSTRTVYRVLAQDRPAIALDLADRLCLAADAHISECRLVYPGGEIVTY